ncbi:MAG: hypothetical protein ABSG61_00650 [Gemmatimonadales bacterium]
MARSSPFLLTLVVSAGLALGVSASRAAAQLPPVVFMEAVGGAGQRTDSTYREVTDSAKLAQYRRWLDNESARFALTLYADARRIAREERHLALQPEAYYVALVPGGNHASVGFRLQTDSGTRDYPNAAYILLDAEDWRFSTTLLHETGHMVLYVLAGGRVLPRRDLIPISHSTAALTDRGTAFDEGFAIHLETVLAQIATEPWLVNRYRHGQLLFGDQPGLMSEYYRQTSDLLTFSQTVGRYALVRDNNFAFEPAYTGPDYFRVQLEPSRDVAALRSADALLQSEGFYASFFFGLLMRGTRIPDSSALMVRERQALTALADVFEHVPLTPGTPYLLHFLAAFARRFPANAAEADDVFLDLSHGVFMDADAEAVWRRHYLAAIRVDLAGLGRDSLNARRARWREQLRTNPDIVFSRLGPQLRCEVANVPVRMLDEVAPLSFDANTAPEGVLRLVPGLSASGIAAWLRERSQRPFTGWRDLVNRVPSVRRVAARLRCDS